MDETVLGMLSLHPRCVIPKSCPSKFWSGSAGPRLCGAELHAAPLPVSKGGTCAVAGAPGPLPS